MGQIADAFAAAWRDYQTDGVPASGEWEPSKAEIRAVGSLVEFLINGISAGLHIEPTVAARDAWYADPDNRDELVYVNNNNGSATDPANGVYEYVGGAPRLAQGFYAGVASIVQPLVTLAQTAATSAQGYAADFATFFDLADLPGGALIMRLKDTLGRLLAGVYEDAGQGIVFYTPIQVPAGTIPYAALADDVKSKFVNTYSDDVNGFLFRIIDAAGVLLFGLPKDASKPITAYVTRALSADNAEGAIYAAANTNYLVEVYKDGGGVSQLRSRRRSDGNVTVLTTATQNSTAPQLTPDDIVIFTRNGATITVPAAGGTETPLTASTDVALVGDSMSDNGSGYPTEVQAALPGYTVYVCAEGGEQTPSIAVSFGVPDLCTLAISGNALPTSGTATFTPSVGFLNNGACCLVEVTAADGSKVLCHAYNATGYYIRPVVYPGAPIPVAAAAPMRCISIDAGGTDPTNNTRLSVLHAGKVVIRTGRNDIGPGRTFVLATYLDLISRMVALVRPVAREILIGDVCVSPNDVPTSQGGAGSMTQAQSQGYIQSILELSAGLTASFPNNKISFYQNFIDTGNTTNVTVNGTVYKMVTATMLPDGTHEGSTGKTLSANLIKTRWQAKGII